MYCLVIWVGTICLDIFDAMNVVWCGHGIINTMQYVYQYCVICWNDSKYCWVLFDVLGVHLRCLLQV